MTAKVKMPKAERVPDALLSRFNAARADALAAEAQVNAALAKMRQEGEAAVRGHLERMNAAAGEIAKACGLDQKAGDKFDPSTGLVKRGNVEAGK
jgi:hypothetical protein